jgi:hypothetical protein
MAKKTKGVGGVGFKSRVPFKASNVFQGHNYFTNRKFRFESVNVTVFGLASRMGNIA